MGDEDDKIEDAVEKALEQRASFWKKMVVATIPVLIPAIVSAGGISAVFNWGNAENAKAEAKTAAETASKTEVAIAVSNKLQAPNHSG